MLYNRCTGIYKFGNNTYPRRIRHSSNLGHIFQEKKCVLRVRVRGNYCSWSYKLCMQCCVPVNEQGGHIRTKGGMH